MKKGFFYAAVGVSLIAASCKETVITTTSASGALAEDTTYVEQTVETAEARNEFIEELTGVTCTNCPKGASVLETLQENNPGVVVVSYHTGIFSDPIVGKSIQNFQTTEARTLRDKLWGTPAGYPAAIFDRIPVNTSSATPLFADDGSDSWAAFLAADKADYTTTPLNLKVTSAYDETQGQYNIEVTVKYTQAVTADNTLNVFLSQDSITDVQEYSPAVYDTAYVFNHVFRKALIDPVYGRIIAKDQDKVAGRVYIYRTALKIDPTDSTQQYWKPEHMHVTAFVTVANNISDFRVLQVKQTTLQ